MTLGFFLHDARTQLARPEACVVLVQIQFSRNLLSRDLNRASTGRESRFIGADGGRH